MSSHVGLLAPYEPSHEHRLAPHEVSRETLVAPYIVSKNLFKLLIRLEIFGLQLYTSCMFQMYSKADACFL